MFRGKQRVSSHNLLLMESLIDDVGSQTGYGYFSIPVKTLEGLGHEAMACELNSRLNSIRCHMDGQQDATHGSGNEADSDPRRIIKETATILAQQVQENIRKSVSEGDHLTFGYVRNFAEMMEHLVNLLDRLDEHDSDDDVYEVRGREAAPDTPRPQHSPRDPLKGVHD